jgi:hypothetical protein
MLNNSLVFTPIHEEPVYVPGILGVGLRRMNLAVQEKNENSRRAAMNKNKITELDSSFRSENLKSKSDDQSQKQVSNDLGKVNLADNMPKKKTVKSEESKDDLPDQ